MSDQEAAGETDSLSITTSFAYRHTFGALLPFFRGLEQGRLLATRCPACSATFCPPRFLCSCGAAIDAWVETGGRGTLRCRTTAIQGGRPQGSAGPVAFGLVAVDGCCNLLFARLAADVAHAEPGVRLSLGRADGPVSHPIQHAVFHLDRE